MVSIAGRRSLSTPGSLDVAAGDHAPPDLRGTVQKALAAAGVAFLFYQGWTWSAWLADGPEQITRFRDTDDFSWYLARVYEGAALTALVSGLTWVIRRCLREHRLTFDAMFCIAGLCTYWLDATANVLQPVFLYSSQWFNFADWTGHMPFLRNPDAGRFPESVLFTLPIYVVGLLLFVKFICAVMGKARDRWSHLTRRRLVLIAVGLGLLIDIAIEFPMFAFDLWALPGVPAGGNLPFLEGAHRYPVAEVLIGMGIWTPMAMLYFFRNDRGQTFIEAGLERFSAPKQILMTQLGLIGFFNGLMVMLASAYWVLGLFSAPYPEGLKPYIVNEACDAPGYSGTRYGPCPGAPGYRMPLPGSLPGPKPYQD